MAVVIDAGVGSATANSYITLVEAQAFADSRIHRSAWDNLTSDDEKNRALVSSTKLRDIV